MNRSMCGVIAVTSVVLTGCNIQALTEDATQAVAAYQQDKSLVESFAADIKRGFNPDTPEYQHAESLYYKAKDANDKLLGQITLAAATGDRGVTSNLGVELARSTMADFVQSATESLSPADRALPILAAFAALPAIYRIVAGLPKGGATVAAQNVAHRVRWRTWDSVAPAGDQENSRRVPKKKRHQPELAGAAG